MAKRRVQKRFDTKEVQGEGSYVILTSLRVKERRDFIKKNKTDDDFSALEWGVELLTKHVIEWNWVGDSGDLLPLPKDEPQVMDYMTDEESEFLANLLVNSDPKN